jgi:lipoprotein-anchoring transpeptidase ErfK/SrfK
MRRVALVSLISACAVAGVLSAFAFAGATPSAVTTTTTTTTGTTTTTPTTTTSPTSQMLPEGVTIGGLPVGNLTPREATTALRSWFRSPLSVQFRDLLFSADPSVLAAPNVLKAIQRAKVAKPFAHVRLVVVTRPARVKAFVAKISARIDRTPVDSRLLLRGGKPFVSKSKPGRALVRAEAERAITKALVENLRDTVVVRAKAVPAQVTRSSFGAAIVINRSANRLTLYHGMRYWRQFGVATGQSAYPTPLGRFEIVVKWMDPWWYPPSSPWAAGLKPIPPGPGNPLGTRWMGLSSPGVGIHGTPDAASIGYSASHGCIRMRISDAEWLFTKVDIGTTVFIVS